LKTRYLTRVFFLEEPYRWSAGPNHKNGEDNDPHVSPYTPSGSIYSPSNRADERGKIGYSAGARWNDARSESDDAGRCEESRARSPSDCSGWSEGHCAGRWTAQNEVAGKTARIIAPIHAGSLCVRGSCCSVGVRALDRGAVLAEALYEIGGVEHPLVFAAAADRDERHL
jgi:hypothetical protein